MTKRQELRDPASCLRRAKDDELIFVLREHDAAFSKTIRQWADERIRLGKNAPGDAQIEEALALAWTVEERRHHEYGAKLVPKMKADRTGFIAFVAVVVFVLAVLLAWYVTPAHGATDSSVFQMTSEESLKLDNLKLRKRLMDAEYTAALTQWRIDVSAYQSDVLKAHPGAQVTFDPNTLSWIRQVGTPAKQDK